MSGPSGGVIGQDGRGTVSRDLLDKHPDLARQFLTIGRHPRAGHDRARWQTVNWDDYRARVGFGQTVGPWRIEAAVTTVVDDWVAQAENMPCGTPGAAYTCLLHSARGLIMSDLPAEIAGALPFLDHITQPWAPPPQVLIGGLGLGIVPAWLLEHTAVARVDVVEIDWQLAELITRGADQPYAVNAWAADPRLHVHYGDIHTWWPPKARPRLGCLLHEECALIPAVRWQAGWMDIWDMVAPENLPSMRRLTRRWARRCKRLWCWERAECEAHRARGQAEPDFRDFRCLHLDGARQPTALIGGPDDYC